MMNQIGITPQMYRDQAVSKATGINSSLGSSIGSTIGSTITAFTGIPALGAIGGLLGTASGIALTNKGKAAGEADEAYGRMIAPMYREQLSNLQQQTKSSANTAYRERMQSMRRNVIPSSVDYLKFI
jgi:hypothetical protein